MLSAGQQLQTDDFDKYLKIFEEGLTSEQVQLICDLISDAMPVQGEALVLEEEA
jgi:hypothetical protein